MIMRRAEVRLTTLGRLAFLPSFPSYSVGFFVPLPKKCTERALRPCSLLSPSTLAFSSPLCGSRRFRLSLTPLRVLRRGYSPSPEISFPAILLFLLLANCVGFVFLSHSLFVHSESLALIVERGEMRFWEARAVSGRMRLNGPAIFSFNERSLVRAPLRGLAFNGRAS